MHYILAGVRFLTGKQEERRDIVFSEGSLVLHTSPKPPGPSVEIKGNDLCLFPGFTDVHVHLREPGFSYKETIQSGTLAAARGGFTCLCAMPNVRPVPDSPDALQRQLNLIKEKALVSVLPYGAITMGQKGEALSDMAGMAGHVAGFSDDGRGVQSKTMMRQAMETARHLDKIIAAHCEDETLLTGGYIHAGAYARLHGHPGITSESEWRQVARDLEISEQTGCKYHVCHVSTRESVDLIRRAKARGVDVSCETAPHYLVLDDSQLEDAGRFKMNPPIRDKRDREALVEGLLDGTIDMIATDHAPHSAEEKSRGLKDSLNGVVGLETAFPVLYTHLVKSGVMKLEQLIRLLSVNPNKRFQVQSSDDYTLFDLGIRETVDPDQFLSSGRNTPFEGMQVYGKCLLTVCQNRVVWQDSTFFSRERKR